MSRTALITFLSDLCPPLLAVNKATIQSHLTGGSKDQPQTEVHHVLDSFIQDPSVRQIAVSKRTLAKERDAPEEFVITVKNNIDRKSLQSQAITVIKRAQVGTLGEEDQADRTSLASQLQVSSLAFGDGEDSALETIQTSLQNTVESTLVAEELGDETGTTKTGGEDDVGGSKPLIAAKKKLQEFLVSIQLAQQSSAFAKVELVCHPSIVEAVAVARSENRKATIADLGQAQDAAYLNALQGLVNLWSREINRVVVGGSETAEVKALNEMLYWLKLESSLKNIADQLQSPEVELQLAVLNANKRCMFYESGTGLKQRLDEVQNVNLLMRDFPLNDLIAASSLDEIKIALQTIFGQLRKIKTAQSYPLPRAYSFLESISRDLSAQLLKVLSQYKLLEMNFSDFDHVFIQCREIFNIWEDEMRRLKEIFRGIAKNRGMTVTPPMGKVYEHIQVKERLDNIRRLRHEDAKFKSVIAQVMLAEGGVNSSLYLELSQALVGLEKCECLDLSKRGISEWEAAKRTYQTNLDKFEAMIANRIRETLARASNGSEMFRVFSDFNALFFRPKIRAAVQEYQSDLIKQVDEDFTNLQNKFRDGHDTTEEALLCQTIDLPPVADHILWLRQLETRVQVSLRRMEDVLGKQWDETASGQKLKSAAEEFLRRLDSNGYFTRWLESVRVSGKLVQTSSIFMVVRLGANRYELSLRCNPIAMSIWKEIRVIDRIPSLRLLYSVKSAADDSRAIYPYYNLLQENVRALQAMTDRLESDAVIRPMHMLLDSDYQKMLSTITLGFQIRWDSERLDNFTRDLTEIAQAMDRKISDLVNTAVAIDTHLRAFKDLPINSPPRDFLKISESVQGQLETLVNAGFTNLDKYVVTLSNDIEKILIEKLTQIITLWKSEFEGWPRNGTKLIKCGALHTVTMVNREIVLRPSVTTALQFWHGQFHQAVGKIANLPKPHVEKPKQETYSYLIEHLSKDLVVSTYDAIHKLMKNVASEVGLWTSFISLWEVNMELLFDTLGDDMQAWMQTVEEARAGRSSLSRHSGRKIVGPIVIDLEEIQPKVEQQYDRRVKEIVQALGRNAGDAISGMLTEIGNIRTNLEKQGNLATAKFATVDPNAISGSDELCKIMTTEIVEFVNRLKHARETQTNFAASVKTLKEAEKALEVARWSFPSEWVPAERLVGEYGTMSQLISLQETAFDRYKPTVKNVVTVLERKIKDSVAQTHRKWNRSKPVGGETDPLEALRLLNETEGMMQNLIDRYDELDGAKASLGLPTGQRLEIEGVDPRIVNEEVKNLKAVWNELGNLHTKMAHVKAKLWTSVAPRQVREELEEILTLVKQIPVRFRQYEAFEKLQESIKEYIAINPLIGELKSESLKDRHWKKISEALNLRKQQNELTLGDIYDSHPRAQETYLRDIMTKAQGESGLSEFLSTVKETWTSTDFAMIVYKQKTKLVSGFDDLFAILDEQLSLLQSMRLSPYYASFEEEASSWADKLTRLRGILDEWLEVQRKWVYLEGVFSGSADIQALLPSEFASFKSIDNDFLALMKKAAGRPKVIDILGQDGLLKMLMRLSDALTKVQKALSDYLEKQRTSFARFYFVGDEDLLEMIGNARDPLVIQRHLNKMFGGISGLSIDPNCPTRILGMMSKEGETVIFQNGIEVTPTTALMTWLTALETNMSSCLAYYLDLSLQQLPKSVPTEATRDSYFNWVASYPTQLIILSTQIRWTSWVEAALNSKNILKSLEELTNQLRDFLAFLAESVLAIEDKLTRTRIIQLITEVVHQRDVCEELISVKVPGPRSFAWLEYMRFYYNPDESDLAKRLNIEIASASFPYGFEYLGVAERLVQTKLTDKCYLTLTQALHLRLGGNPFGPAGTGKTETVKFMGATLGRFVLVFNCDEAFDFHAMGRIFVGLCEVGAWGCFDEFNRLEERMLSAVSEQILTIQTGLREKVTRIDLLNHELTLSPNVGIFVTMNPGYAGRSNLPDNLKQLFREFAMIVPDKTRIAEVLLYSQGFDTAHQIAPKIVSLFDLCLQQLTKQPHYDFGLRALKAVLSSAGHLKRNTDLVRLDDSTSLEVVERDIILRSICDSLVPKLIQRDVPRLQSLLTSVFPGSKLVPVEEAVLETELIRLCAREQYEPEKSWLQKVLQIYQIQKLNHGLMLVGPTGVGKTAAWSILLEAMSSVDGVTGVSHVIDPKALSKEQLYGKLDQTSLEWTDGVFTATLRKILNSQNTRVRLRHWIIFDGDVDPDWAENLNSVLDDNKLLTLPNGERFQIPSNVRLVFEVDTLQSATLATVSRCGMVWMSDDTLPLSAVFSHHLAILSGESSRQDVAEEMSRLRSSSRLMSRMGSVLLGGDNTSVKGRDVSENLLEEQAVASALRAQTQQNKKGVVTFTADIYRTSESAMRVRQIVARSISSWFETHGVVLSALEAAEEAFHIMDFTKIRVIETLFGLLEQHCVDLIDLQEEKGGFSTTNNELPEDFIHTCTIRQTIIAICWAFGGSMPLAPRINFAQKVSEIGRGRIDGLDLPSGVSDSSSSLLDYTINQTDGGWVAWKDLVSDSDLSASQVEEATLVIETSDTRSHKTVIGSYLKQRRPFILCGPPGCGKTMTLNSALKANSSEFDVASLNFSSGTTPEMLIKTFNHYCEYVKTSNGVVLRPNTPNKWLILFCDEINLPEPDKYGTQKVISFLRQMVTAKTFWQMTSPGVWESVKLERIQFAGACNPPTDSGRHPMSNRFLRNAPVLFVDFPGTNSLKKIYGTFNRAMLRGPMRSLADPLTEAMVQFYQASQAEFTVDQQPHYIYSPRELTRWKVAIFEAIRDRDAITAIELSRLAIHEAQRIFGDRLVEEVHRQWTDGTLDDIFLRSFPSLSPNDLKRPLLFSPIITGNYDECDVDRLKDFVEAKMELFYEEEVAVKLVLFDECLHHILRIDRVLRQPLGHLLLVGVSGAGKTILSKFVSWLNGLYVFQIKAGRNYDTLSFEADLRTVMKRAGVKEEKICFIFDESNVLGPAFLERMNALLAAGEVPGLFEQDELTQLMGECRAAFGGDLDEAELFTRFTKQVQRNLHIIFTMNPANPDFYNRQATSPALFNRCVIDWFGDWPEEALLAVASEFTKAFEVSSAAFVGDVVESDRREHLSKAVVGCHQAVAVVNEWLARQGKKRNFVAPRDFLDFIRHILTFVSEKRGEVAETTRHLSVGLTKLAETETQVAELQASLAEKETELAAKEKLSAEKMQAMVTQKAEAEEKKRQAEIIAANLDASEAVIKERKATVEIELGEVEPLLLEAKQSVESIPKRALDELRAMTSPPSLVKLCCEAVVMLLSDAGDKGMTWEEVRRVMRGDFIQKILTFDPTKPGVLSPATVGRIKQKYLTSSDWDYDRIDKASKAAGPLAKWVASSCSFAEIILKVDPLRKEIDELETALRKNKLELERTKSLITSLEATLSQLQSEYAQLIADEQLIKREMESVNKKVASSVVLLRNLASEQERWSTSCIQSDESLKTDVGDNVLAAAFSTYIGFFEQGEREKLMSEWQGILESNLIRCQHGLSMIEYLSKPAERYDWLANGLPSDDLSLENTVVLKRFLRYPLIIDPSGQATEFICKLYADQKMVRTSYTEPSFVKQLESALRFGTALMVQDVEELDTFLNNVLNQETHKVGGRSVITVGDTEIDFSPSFMLFLVTRDPTLQVTPDLSSRVTLINYTTTPASLRNQCLNLVLKSERPEVDKKRRDVLKLQGEFRVRMRELEDKLLHSLSNVSGNILDDDRVMSTLENLKAQAQAVAVEAANADQVVEEVERTTALYLPIADAAARLYTTLEHLSSIYFLYHYDLKFFETMFKETLGDKASLNSIRSGDYSSRADKLLANFFKRFYDRCSLSQLHKDGIVLALQLSRVRFESMTGISLDSAELEALLQGRVVGALGLKQSSMDRTRSARLSTVLKDDLTEERRKAVEALVDLPAFRNLPSHLAKNEAFWKSWINHSAPESIVPPDQLIDPPMKDEHFLNYSHFKTLSPDLQMLACSVIQSLRLCLIVKALRPDRLRSSLEILISRVMGDAFLQTPVLSQDLLTDLLKNSITPTTPVIFISSPGFDPSGRVVQAASATSRSLSSIAMGSQEGYVAAEKAIQAASRQGSWVLLKNVHLASAKWLAALEKMIFKLGQNDKLRVFLTMEFKDKIPTNLLRVSYKFVFEPPVGIKAALEKTFAAHITPPRTLKEPAPTRNRLYFLAAFLHAIILERKRFTPIGWTKAYEFSDADLLCSLEIIDEWLDQTGTSDPEKIPWGALRTLIRDVVYGGRLDNELDRRILHTFVDRILGASAFEENSDLISGGASEAIRAPPLSRSVEGYVSWIRSLPSNDEPGWIGLAAHAERLLASDMAAALLVDWDMLNNRSAEELRALLPTRSFKPTSLTSKTSIDLSESSMLIRPARALSKQISRMVSSLGGGKAQELLGRVGVLRNSVPSNLLDISPKSADQLEHPLFRFFETEVKSFQILTADVQSQLADLELVAMGKQKFTNLLRGLANCVVAGETPKEWISYDYTGAPEARSLAEWVFDLNRRAEQLAAISKAEYNGGFAKTELRDEEAHEVMRKRVLADMTDLLPNRTTEGISARSLWPGGLNQALAYLSATQQQVAQSHQWPVDTLRLTLEIGNNKLDDQSCLLSGLYLSGAYYNAITKSLTLSDQETCRLPTTRLRWAQEEDKLASGQAITLPIFVTRSRQHLLAFAEIGVDEKQVVSDWYQRGVAFILWWSSL